MANEGSNNFLQFCKTWRSTATGALSNSLIFWKMQEAVLNLNKLDQKKEREEEKEPLKFSLKKFSPFNSKVMLSPQT